jgi:hypothetical protein
MTEQERNLIAGLAERIRNAPAPAIDRDADDLIQRTIGARPDALYILTQTVLLQEMALNQTKAQLEELRRQTAPAPSGGFLHSAPSEYQNPAYQGSYQTAPPPPPPSGGGFSGFFHNVATTAAGVLAGEVAFDALSGLFGHRGGGFFGGGGGFFGSPSGLVPGSETIVNNYYNDANGGDVGGLGGDSRYADAAAASGDQMSPDIDDERDNSGDAFADTSGDDSSYDDGSSFDSGGGSDDGGSF